MLKLADQFEPGLVLEYLSVMSCYHIAYRQIFPSSGKRNVSRMPSDLQTDLSATLCFIQLVTSL